MLNIRFVVEVDAVHKAIEFLVADDPKRVDGRRVPICGFTWIIESSRTSFYIKSLVPAWGFAKISLHGPDPVEGDPHNRLDFEEKDELIAKAMRAGGTWSFDFSLQGPEYFEGKQVNKRTRHVVRFRTSWEHFVTGAPSGPPPIVKGKATQKRRIDPPSFLKVSYIDIFISSVRPYFPDGADAARNQDWLLGPMVNDANQYLTGFAHCEDQFRDPDPFAEEREGLPADECFRDLGYVRMDDGVLWVCEMLSSPHRRTRAVLWPPRRRPKS